MVDLWGAARTLARGLVSGTERILIPLGAWLVSCVLLGACALCDTQFRGTITTAVGGRLCSPTLAQLCGSEFCEEHLMCRTGLEACATATCHAHRLEACATHLCLHALAGPTTALACCSGRAGTFGGDQPGFVARPLEARRFVARGNWHASIEGCAVTGARKVVDVGGCLVAGFVREWRF